MDDSREWVLGERGKGCRGGSRGDDKGNVVITRGELLAELHARV